MASNKLVVKCGNFAVLVDLHVLPRGSSTDTSWFSDPEKEEVCMLLKDPIDLRVKQYMESRKKQQGQPKHKEFTQCNPLFLKGDHFRIAAYFLKRWVNLRCVLQWQYRGLHVFPYRFVVCASLHEPGIPAWTSASSTTKENVASGISEYFGGCIESGNLPSATKRQQDILKDIMKKTKIKESAMIKSVAQKILPVSADSKTEHTKNEDAPSSSPCETLCVRMRPPVGCEKAANSSSDTPKSETEYFANQRQPDDSSSQLKPHFTERSNTDTLATKLPSSPKIELPEAKQSQVTQHKRRRRVSDENVVMCKKAAYGRDRKILKDVTIIQKSNNGGPMQTFNPEFSRPNLIQSASLEKVQRSVSEISMEQANYKVPISCSVESSVVHTPSNLKISCNSSNILMPEDFKKIPNQPKKLKLQRIKK